MRRGAAAQGEAEPAAGGAKRLQPARRGVARRLCLALAMLLAALGLAELGLRQILFGEGRLARAYARELRRPELYVRGYHEDDYWKLQGLWRPAPRRPAPRSDPLLGWTGNVLPGTYEHPDEALVGERRPILLYGDSNAQCLTSPDDCFQGLLESSDLGSRYALLNYGVGGHGLDQIYLMLRESIDRHAHRDPIVIVSMMVDDDLERSMLTFREWPKPRFWMEAGRLVEPRPVVTDPERFFAENPPSIRSYLYRLVRRAVFPSQLALGRTPAELAERRALNGALLEAIRAELESRSLRYFFFLFYFESGLLRVGGAQWSEDLLLEFLARTGTPYISMRDFYAVVCDEGLRCLDELTGRDDPTLGGHYNEAGNRLAFEAMRQGIEERFGELDLERVRRMAAEGHFLPAGPQSRGLSLLGQRARLRFAGRPPAVRQEGRIREHGGELIALRAGGEVPTELELDLDGGWSLFCADVAALAAGGESCDLRFLRLWTRLDEGEWSAHRIELGAPSQPISIELAGTRQLALRIAHEGEGEDCAWLVLRRARIE